MFCLCAVTWLINLALLVGSRLSAPPPADAAPSPCKRSVRVSALKCLAAACLAAAHIEYCNLGPVVRELRIPMAGLPPSLDGFRIVHLSDLHIGPTCRRACAAAIVDAAVRLRPDLFVVTGDVIDGAAAAHRAAAEPLRRLQAHAPAVMVTGNHDHLHGDVDNVLDLMAALGVAPLRNEARTVARRPRPAPGAAAAGTGGGAGLRVAGVDDATAGLWAGFGPNVSAALGGAGAAAPLVLLAHQPATARHAVRAWAARGGGGGEGAGGLLVLSGHTHCGQMLPLRPLAWLANPYFCGWAPSPARRHAAALLPPCRPSLL
jgi:predicted MPP superfamily phosphohydrolase